MKREDLTTIGKKTDAELALLTVVEESALLATMAERDAVEAGKAEIAQKHADALAAKDAERAKLQEEHQAAVTVLQEAGAAALAAKEQEKADAIAAEVAEKEAKLKELAELVEAVSTLPEAVKLREEKEKQRRHDELMRKKLEGDAAAEELAKLGV